VGWDGCGAGGGLGLGQGAGTDGVVGKEGGLLPAASAEHEGPVVSGCANKHRCVKPRRYYHLQLVAQDTRHLMQVWCTLDSKSMGACPLRGRRRSVLLSRSSPLQTPVHLCTQEAVYLDTATVYVLGVGFIRAECNVDGQDECCSMGMGERCV